VKQLGDKAIVTLGNHDLHLLAVALNTAKKLIKDTLDSILTAPDRMELLDWLRTRPLLHHDKSTGFTLIHAGLPPQWDLQQATDLAHEVEDALIINNFTVFFEHMYGDKPDRWSDDLTGWDRLRMIVNTFTRLRYCDEQGRLALKEKGPPGSQSKPYQPWFTISSRKTKKEKIIFGHWSTIHFGNIKNLEKFNVYPLDTGCMWGGSLTTLRLEDKKWFSIPSGQPKIFKEKTK
jgi:bis(5'-nucleosyl)-tetraphosphatase (symmetrical)